MPFGPGGSGDIVSRIVARELEQVTGQPFVVDNKPGATAMVGTAIVKHAPTDGYTLLHGSTSSLAANPSLYKTMTYDPDDFITVAIDGTIPNFMLVAKDAPWKSVKEFVADAKQRKEPLFSGFGNASSRVPSALFESVSGVKLEEVAYKDAVPAIQDLIAGRVHVTFPDQVIGESYVRTGQVRALAVTSEKRSPQYPDIEAIAETYPGLRGDRLPLLHGAQGSLRRHPAQAEPLGDGGAAQARRAQAPARHGHHAAAQGLGHREVRRFREARTRALDPLHQAREDRAAVTQACSRDSSRA